MGEHQVDPQIDKGGHQVSPRTEINHASTPAATIADIECVSQDDVEHRVHLQRFYEPRRRMRTSIAPVKTDVDDGYAFEYDGEPTKTDRP